MLLAFNLSSIITIPFGYLLDYLYRFTSNYGVALILFTVVVKLVLFPVQAKAKKSMMKMSRLTPKVQKLQEKFAGDQAKQNEAVQALYREEGVSMGGGCLWSLVPMLIIFPLYAVVRQPIVYMLHETLENANQIVEIIKTALPDVFSKNTYYDQMIAAQYIPQFAEQIKSAVDVSAHALAGIDFSFLGIDLGAVPQFNIFAWDKWDWAHIGSFLIPMLSAGSQVLSMWISTKMNNSLVTNEKGIQDEETAKNSQANQTNKIMMWTMPLMSLWIGLTIPCALSLYWLVQGLLAIVQDVYLTQHYRKIYDAEDAVKLKKALEEEALEAEKERIRAQRRAENPEGISTNTSKKKLQKQQLQEEEAAKAAARREYEARKGVPPQDKPEKDCLSGIPDRPYCKGRAYDPNHYAAETTEE